MLNFLLQNANIIDLFFNGDGINMNWIAKLISGLVGACGIVGVGVIVFTLILKLITLPLDVYSKASMRKNSLKMEKMRPQLEKLQKQYANDQQMYNAKMMELYKKNGYSMMGACLPLIVSLVVFMVVLNAFTSYSKYMDMKVFNEMANEYSFAVLEHSPYGDEEFEPVIRYDVKEHDKKSDDGKTQYEIVETSTYRRDGDFISYVITRTKITTDQNDRNFDTEDVSAPSTVYYVETQTMIADSSIREELDAIRSEQSEADDDAVCLAYMKKIGRAAAQMTYEEKQVGFLWVKNIWYPDTAFNHPIKDYKGFKSFVGFNENRGKYITDTIYDEITYNIKGEMKAPNGYFILIIVSIGTMFLSQFTMARAQKAQNELQTADGRGQKTQKMMMIIMPIMFGVFSFMYSAAFSIYMIVSSIFGIISSVGTNIIIDKRFKKLEEKELQEKYNRRIPQNAKSEIVTRKEKKKR